ncbi:MAG TPA: hypothetical protein VMZ73_07730 [Acidimicrobiales bacterium]|nr:hypothetical protein [Acidimicrobiales bacterium]
MPHMVMFRSADGKPAYHETDSLDEAIGFVEHLGNHEKVPEARIFRMEEIPIAVKTYYKVEVSPAQPAAGTAEASPAAPAVSAPPQATAPSPSAEPTGAREPVTVPADEPVVSETVVPAGGANGARFGRFNRS